MCVGGSLVVFVGVRVCLFVCACVVCVFVCALCSVVCLCGFVIYFNYKIPNATYMYLQGDDLGETLTKLLPANQFGRLAVFLPIIMFIFGIHFLVFFFIRKSRSKKEEAVINEEIEVKEEIQN